MKYLLVFLIILVIFTISLILGMQNTQPVVFNYLFTKKEYQLSNLLAMLFTLGFTIGGLICGTFWLKTKIYLIRAERRIKNLEHQIKINNI